MTLKLVFESVTTENASEFWSLFLEQAKEQGAEKYLAGSFEKFKVDLANMPALSFFLVKLNGDVVGGFGYEITYSIFQTAPVMKAKSIYVLPAYRGKGFAREIMVERARRAEKLGCVRIEADVIKENVTAQKFLESMNFEEEDEPFLQYTATRPTYKSWL